MKQSGYRTTFHIYSIFFLSLLGMLLMVCCLFAMLITAPNPNGKNVRSDWAKNFTLDFSDYIIFVDGSPTVKQTGIERLQDNHIGLQILNTAGNEVYACQKPGNAQNTYSNADLLQLNQTGRLDTEDMTSFVGIVTECRKEYAYSPFPYEHSKSNHVLKRGTVYRREKNCFLNDWHFISSNHFFRVGIWFSYDKNHTQIGNVYTGYF